MRSLTGRGLFINICHCALVAQSNHVKEQFIINVLRRRQELDISKKLIGWKISTLKFNLRKLILHLPIIKLYYTSSTTKTFTSC